MRRAMDPERVLTQREAAAFLGLSQSTLKRLDAAGKLRRVMLSPRRIGYLLSDLIAYLRAGRGLSPVGVSAAEGVR